jgi:hypothetical protein
MQFAGHNRLKLTERSMVGCAGAVAELCWDRECIDPDYWTDPDMMSTSDWRLSGCEPGEPDDLCIEAIKNLEGLLSEGGPLWVNLLRQARRLIMDVRK